MENLNIEATKSTPKVVTDDKKKLLKMEGQSYPENAIEFYNPIIEWLNDFIKDLNGTFTIDLDLIYLNTSSLKIIMTIFDILDDAKNNGKDIVVNWYYDKENDLALECGEEFKEGLSFPFHIIEKK